jgi:hypothetical protein
MKNILLIVGDRFQAFRDGKVNVQTYSEFLGSAAAQGWNKDVLPMPGQGLSDVEIATILALHSEHDPDALEVLATLPNKKAEATHKRHARNIVIGEIKRSGKTCYDSSLLVDDDCAEMADHNSGQHLQAMVLIEACRQLLLAIAETFLIEEGERGHKYFVFNSLNINFKTFAFPLPTDLRCRFVSEDRKLTSASFVAEIDIVQAGVSVSTATIEYGFFSSEFLTRRENSAANKATQRELDRIIAALEPQPLLSSISN